MNNGGKFYDGKNLAAIGYQRYICPNNAGTLFQLLSKIAVQHIIVLCLIGQACCQLGHTIINKPDSRKDARFLPEAPTIEAIKYT